MFEETASRINTELQRSRPKRLVTADRLDLTQFVVILIESVGFSILFYLKADFLLRNVWSFTGYWWSATVIATIIGVALYHWEARVRAQ